MLDGVMCLAGQPLVRSVRMICISFDLIICVRVELLMLLVTAAGDWSRALY